MLWMTTYVWADCTFSWFSGVFEYHFNTSQFGSIWPRWLNEHHTNLPQPPPPPPSTPTVRHATTHPTNNSTTTSKILFISHLTGVVFRLWQALPRISVCLLSTLPSHRSFYHQKPQSNRDTWRYKADCPAILTQYPSGAPLHNKVFEAELVHHFDSDSSYLCICYIWHYQVRNTE